MMKLDDRIFHVISNTHWDREWRYPFQRNRQMLVDMIDRVLDILQKEPKYKAFHLDSQSIVLKDYLEIRPHKKSLIQKFVKQKRLLIGPWYILPEEFQVGGENLIRNLLLGHKICKEIGRVSKIGYSPFSWGQISQLPQIYNEFKIELIMFYRGINSIDSKKAEFIWEGADGTKLISSRFSTMPRYNFYFYIYRKVMFDQDFGDVEHKWSNGDLLFHPADKELYEEDYSIAKNKNEYHSKNIKCSVERIIKDQVNDFTTPHVIWMEGHDSSGPNITTVKLIEDIKREFPNLNVVHSTLEDYAAAIKKSADEKKLKLVKGERRSAQFDRRSGNLYGYTTSARMYLKQKNFKNEKWLQYYAEPFNSFSGLIGRDINDKYLDTAWELLIQNSAHDSIGGCSLDEIHDDMMNRYKHSIQIAQGVFERSVKYIVKNIDHSKFDEAKSDIFLTAINPNNYTRNEIAEAVIDIPEGFDRNGFEVVDADGSVLETQIIKSSKSQPVLEEMTNRPMYLSMKRYNAFIDFKNIPPFGLKSFNIIPRSKKTQKKYSISKTVRNKIILENDHLKVSINKNGTFNLIDKPNSKSFKDFGYFYDEGEAGHAWVNEPLKPFVTTLKSTPKIRILTNGNLSSSVSIKHSIKIFKDLTGRKNNSKKLVFIPIELIITLNKNSKRVDLKIEVDNKAESHRLRIMFPTGLNAKHSFGEGQFDAIKRDIKRPPTDNWIEQPMYDYPMHHFVEVPDSKNGLAILANGLKEYEVLDDTKKTLAITLFRCFEYIIQPSSKQDYSDKKGSQCLGKQIFNIAVYPHKGDWSKGKVYEQAMNYSYPIRLAQSGKATGKLKPLTSFMEIEPKEIIFSCFKRSEDNDGGFILRMYNPTNKIINGELNFLNSISEAWIVTLEELKVSKIQLSSSNSIKFKAERKKIISIKLKFKGM